MFWKKKPVEVVELDDLAGAIAHRYYKTLIKRLAPGDTLPWLKDVVARAGPEAFNREWIVLSMFVSSEAFTRTFEGQVCGEDLIKGINNKVFRAFAEQGLFDPGSVYGFVSRRYIQYFEGIKIAGNFFAGATNEFLGIVGDTSGLTHLVLEPYLVESFSIDLRFAKATMESDSWQGITRRR